MDAHPSPPIIGYAGASHLSSLSIECPKLFSSQYTVDQFPNKMSKNVRNLSIAVVAEIFSNVFDDQLNRVSLSSAKNLSNHVLLFDAWYFYVLRLETYRYTYENIYLEIQRHKYFFTFFKMFCSKYRSYLYYVGCFDVENITSYL